MGISINIEPKKRKRKRRGRNDNLYLFNIIFASSYTISLLLLTIFFDKDISSYASISPYIYAELGVHTGFYIWKCKVENCRKFKDVNRLRELESEVDYESDN